MLALSQDEAKQWQQMRADVEYEQVGFCRMMARGLAPEAAGNETHVPSFAASWVRELLPRGVDDGLLS